MSNFKNFYKERNPNLNFKSLIPPRDSIPNSSEAGLVVTFEKAELESGRLIFSSANTAWWSHDPKDLKNGPIPLDEFGSPLFESTNVKGWFNAEAIMKHPAYGVPERRLRNFMLAHAKNIHLVINKLSKETVARARGFEAFCKLCDANNI